MKYIYIKNVEIKKSIKIIFYLILYIMKTRRNKVIFKLTLNPSQILKEFLNSFIFILTPCRY